MRENRCNLTEVTEIQDQNTNNLIISNKINQLFRHIADLQIAIKELGEKNK